MYSQPNVWETPSTHTQASSSGIPNLLVATCNQFEKLKRQEEIIKGSDDYFLDSPNIWVA